MIDKTNFMAYMSDFYYVVAVIFFILSTFFMFNEPSGASMLSFDMSLLLVVFAILYVAASMAKKQILEFLAKYLVFIGFMVVCFQFMIDYGNLSLLQIVFAVSVAIFLINFIFDFIFYIPNLLGIIWGFVKQRR